jgi:hypothetical protein
MPADLSPVTNPSAQEALSTVQGNRTVLLVPLKDGSVAVFGRDFQLHAILDSAPSFEELVDLSTELFLKLFNRRAEYEFLGEPSDAVWKRDAIRAQRDHDRGRTVPRTIPRPGIAFDLGEE